jgi:uncharacterized protein (DUF1499 family)
MRLRYPVGSYFSFVGIILAIIAVLLAMLAGSGSRWGWWHFRTGFSMLRWTAEAGLVAAALSIAGVMLSWRQISRVGLVLSISGLVIGLLVVGDLWSWWHTAQRVPAIHDISTDTENPPRFVSVLPLRKEAPNPAEYGGPEIAEKQRAAYPDLAPAMLSVPPSLAFNQALQSARDMGWTIVDSNPGEGRIEATDTTFWFSFKDDIVIRVTPAGQGSRIDVRSVSRVGRSDVGTNAKRIRTYLNRLIQKNP